MNRFLLFPFVFALGLPVVLTAQESPQSHWRRTDDDWSRKNSITFTTSLFGFTGYNAQAAPVSPVFNLEYDRMVYRNLSVSVISLYARIKGSLATDTYTMKEDFYFAGAKINYNLPVIHNWLYFRTGIGAGAGIHDVTDYFMGEAPASEPSLERRVKAHAIVDMHLVFRATRWLEFRVSPLLVTPTQFIVGSKFNAPYNDKTYFYWNPLGTLGVSARF
jgi:hypothetical protein